MELIPVIMIAFALSADAFAVSITNGMCFKDITFLQALKIGTAFGLFQAFMPVIGWFAGSKISSAHLRLLTAVLLLYCLPSLLEK